MVMIVEAAPDCPVVTEIAIEFCAVVRRSETFGPMPADVSAGESSSSFESVMVRREVIVMTEMLKCVGRTFVTECEGLALMSID